MSWWTYVERVKGSDTQDAVAAAIGVKGSTVSRWRTGGADPKHVAAFARHYHRPVLEAFVEAAFLTPAEAKQRPTAQPSLDALSDEELLDEIRDRMATHRGSVGAGRASHLAVVSDPQLFLTEMEKRVQPVVQSRLRDELQRVGTGLADGALFEVVQNAVAAIHTTNFDGLIEATRHGPDFVWKDGEGNALVVEVKDAGSGLDRAEVREVLADAMAGLEHEDRQGGWRRRGAEEDAREVAASQRAVERGAVERQKRDLERQRRQAEDEAGRDVERGESSG